MARTSKSVVLLLKEIAECDERGEVLGEVVRLVSCLTRVLSWNGVRACDLAGEGGNRAHK